MDKATMKDALQAQIQVAQQYLAEAQKDIEREDRLDAIDMLHMAEHRLAQTRQAIASTLPAVLRNADDFARDTRASGV